MRRPDDPRLGEMIETWNGDEAAFTPGRAVLLGFPQDEGVRRNGGRTGAAEAPNEIRRWLRRLTPWDCQANLSLADPRPLDLGNARIAGELEESQAAVGDIIGAVLQRGAIPIVLGGGHETAFGHYLGYAAARRKVAIINLDAHLDLRPLLDGKGHSGSPFRQALEHGTHPLAGEHYVCLGAQPHSVSRHHWHYACQHGCTVRWGDEVRHCLGQSIREGYDRLSGGGRPVYVSIDADVVRAADVMGVSAPNSLGLSGAEVAACARMAGSLPHVSSLDLVEINPRLDRDHQSARWGALVVWSFLAGLASRQRGSQLSPDSSTNRAT
ncbi:MAG TPA: formimidoylglutamase [Gemmataceae bacterium]|nr:formimidoylglutamase [Gemmataceae bacterium]